MIMNTIETEIKDLLIFEPRLFTDDRGWFMESFNQKSFENTLLEQGQEVPIFLQDNHSVSQKGVLRGLHYQLAPYAQGKLVRVVQGRALDVAVDIRRNSSSYGHWLAIELTAENHRQLWIPEGFAHGFLSLEDDTHFLYKTTNYYSKEHERSIVWNDETLNIDWSIGRNLNIQLTDKDKFAPTLIEMENSLSLF